MKAKVFMTAITTGLQNLGLNATEDEEEILTLRREIRERFVDIVATAPVDSVDALDQVSSVMTSVLEQHRELTLHTQVMNAAASVLIWYPLSQSPHNDVSFTHR